MLRLEPRSPRATAGLASTFLYEWMARPDDTLLVEAYDLARHALTLDGADAWCQMIVGRVHLTARRFELVEHFYDRAERLNPNDTDILASRGAALAYFGRAEDGVASVLHAKRLNPYHPDWYDEVIAILGRMRDPTQGNRLLAACHGLLGQVEIARAFGREVLADQPDFSIEAWNKRLPQDPRQGVTDRYIEGLRLAGLPP